jgi:hypothetical protein
MSWDEEERTVLEKFQDWLLRDDLPIRLKDGRIIKQSAEYRAESPTERKRRLREPRYSRKHGGLSNSESELLDLQERTSQYSNKSASVSQQKTYKERARGNVEEAKRLYVAALIARALHPGKDPYKQLNELCDLHPDSRSIERKIQRFKTKLINSGQLDCERVVEEQFSRYRSPEVLAHSVRLIHAWKLPLSQRVFAFTRAQRERPEFGNSEKKLLAHVCRTLCGHVSA